MLGMRIENSSARGAVDLDVEIALHASFRPLVRGHGRGGEVEGKVGAAGASGEQVDRKARHTARSSLSYIVVGGDREPTAGARSRAI